MLPEVVDRSVARERTHLACVYGLSGAASRPLRDKLKRPHAVWDLARFASHYARSEAGVDDVPLIGPAIAWDSGSQLSTRRGKSVVVTFAEARAVVIPYSATLLLLELELEPNVSLRDSIVALQETCFRKETLKIDERKVLEAAIETLPDSLTGASFGGDVHQVLFPGGALLEELGGKADTAEACNTDSLLRLVYREDAPFRPGASSMRYLKELNRPTESIAAHGRGVSVIAGAAPHVERGILLTGMELVACSERLRAIRREATRELDSVRATQAVRLDKIEAERIGIAARARHLRDLELQLAFGVAQYLDNLRIPEIVLTAYRRSLSDSLQLTEGVERTSSMIDRLRRVIEARQVELAAAAAAIDESRRRANSWALGYVSLVAVPIGIILAFLGASVRQVSERRSIWDVQHYWLYYSLAVTIVLLGGIVYLIMRRRQDAGLRTRFGEQ